jgi:hypothetical protein
VSQWFIKVRQDFIRATLKQFGQINRKDLVREFGVSPQQASNDIAAFLAADPPNVEYDVRAKCYVVVEQQDAIRKGGET